MKKRRAAFGESSESIPPTRREPHSALFVNTYYKIGIGKHLDKLKYHL